MESLKRTEKIKINKEFEIIKLEMVNKFKLFLKLNGVAEDDINNNFWGSTNHLGIATKWKKNEKAVNNWNFVVNNIVKNWNDIISDLLDKYTDYKIFDKFPEKFVEYLDNKMILVPKEFNMDACVEFKRVELYNKVANICLQYNKNKWQYPSLTCNLINSNGRNMEKLKLTEILSMIDSCSEKNSIDKLIRIFGNEVSIDVQNAYKRNAMYIWLKYHSEEIKQIITNCCEKHTESVMKIIEKVSNGISDREITGKNLYINEEITLSWNYIFYFNSDDIDYSKLNKNFDDKEFLKRLKIITKMQIDGDWGNRMYIDNIDELIKIIPLLRSHIMLKNIIDKNRLINRKKYE